MAAFRLFSAKSKQVEGVENILILKNPIWYFTPENSKQNTKQSFTPGNSGKLW